MTSLIRQGAMALALSLGVLAGAPARAALFDDTEARQAIVALRTQVAKIEADAKARAEEVDGLKKSLLELNSQLEQARIEIARLRGQDEQFAQAVADVQRVQKDIRQGVDDRMRKLEPQTVSVDGRQFQAEPDETRLYEEAVAVMRKSDFAGAANLLGAFLQRYPASGYAPTALYWHGNALYGKRDYKEAIAVFRSLVARAPDHPRAPEALLSIASCQADMKDTKGARRTLDEVIKTYPNTETAVAAKERLASLR